MRELTPKIVKKILKDLDAILLDCDGVLYRGETVIEGTPEVVKKLQSMGKRIFYVTNNASKSRKEFTDKLVALGFPATEDTVINSGYAVSCYLNDLKSKGTRNIGKIFCLGSEGLVEELEAVGLTVFKKEIDPPGKGIDLAATYALDPEVDCVLASLDEDLTYLKVAKAARYLSLPACYFAATNEDASLPVSSNIFLPDSGPLVAMLSTATGRKPNVVCGKPGKVMFEVAQKKFGLHPNKTLMVGDRLDTDIAFAKACKMKSLLVQTGASTVAEARKSKVKPDYFLNSLADMLNMLDVQE